MRRKMLNFVEDHWADYSSEFEGCVPDRETVESLSKVVVYNVVRRRIDIDNIKKGVNL